MLIPSVCPVRSAFLPSVLAARPQPSHQMISPARAQLRQRAQHPKTLYSLEAAIRQHRMARGVVKVERVKDGLDFNFHRRQHAQSFVGCICSLVPTRVKPSTSVVATNAKTGNSNVRHVWAVEVAPVCRGDLVCLARPLSSPNGRVGPLALVSRIGHSVHLVDPTSGGTAEVSSEAYWNHPFLPLASRQHLSTFVVIDAELDAMPWQQPLTHKSRGRGRGSANKRRGEKTSAQKTLPSEGCNLAAIHEVESSEIPMSEGWQGGEEGELCGATQSEGGVVSLDDDTRSVAASSIASSCGGQGVVWRGSGFSQSKSRLSASSRRGDGARPWLMGDVTVARETDLGSNDETACIRSHLTELLHSGDEVLGYLLLPNPTPSCPASCSDSPSHELRQLLSCVGRYDLEAMSHLMSNVKKTPSDDMPAVLLVQKKEQRPSRMRKSRSHRRRRNDLDASDVGSTTTNTTYQDLDGLVDDGYDDLMGDDEMAQLISFMDKLGSGSANDIESSDGERPSGGECLSGERSSDPRFEFSSDENAECEVD